MYISPCSLLNLLGGRCPLEDECILASYSINDGNCVIDLSIKFCIYMYVYVHQLENMHIVHAGPIKFQPCIDMIIIRTCIKIIICFHDYFDYLNIDQL